MDFKLRIIAVIAVATLTIFGWTEWWLRRDAARGKRRGDGE